MLTFYFVLLCSAIGEKEMKSHEKITFEIHPMGDVELKIGGDGGVTVVGKFLVNF